METPARTRRLDFAFRALAVIFLSLFILRAAIGWRTTHLPVFLLLIIAESLTVALVVISRNAQVRSTHPVDLFFTVVGTYFFLLFVSFGETRTLLPQPVGESLQVVSILMQIVAKATLGRSFGLLPANRGIVSNGPYRLVRHPIYLSYLVGHVGFLLGLFSPVNLLVVATLYSAQIVRILREERVLMQDPAYRDYAQRVHWRLLPGVF